MQKHSAPSTEAEDEDSQFKPLTAQEAAQWRARNPATSVWKIVAWQAVVGGLVALLAGVLSGQAPVGWSAAYGAVVVVFPAALFARGISRSPARAAQGAVAQWMGWELAKIALTVVLLAAAPRVVPQLSWLALLGGMVITMKMYWVALWVRPGVRKTD